MDNKLFDLVQKNTPLFWSISKSKLDQLNDEAVVEAILNYGDNNSVKELFEILGVKYVARIFYQQTKRARINYFPQVVNYFNLYFKKHVS